MKHRFLSILSAAVIASAMASPIFSTAADTENSTDTSGVTSVAKLSTEKATTFLDVLGDRFKIGSLITPYEFTNYADYFTDNFNNLAPAYCLTPDMLLSKDASIELGENDNPQIDLHFSDSMLKYCEENEIPISPGTFVFYSQTPSWFFKENFKDSAPYVNEETMNKRLENLIKNTFELLKKNYPNLIIDSYEVCKEVFVNDGGGYRTENNNWFRVYDDDEFIFNAFTYARKYAPENTKLLYCDYNETMPEKTDDIYNLALKLKEKNLIDGIGLEGYISKIYPTVQDYKTALDKLSALGLDIRITEFNIYEHEKMIYDLYPQFIKLFKQYDCISTIVFEPVAHNNWNIKNTLSKILDAISKPEADINGDGSFDIADAVMLSKIITSRNIPDNFNTAYADLDGDGEINVFDLLKLRNILLTTNS